MAKNRLGIDLSKFKHLKSDAKSTTLQHKDGHTMTLAHNVLSKPNQEALKALANVGAEARTESQRQEAEDQAKHPYGRVIVKEAEGGQVAPADEEKAKAVSDYARGEAAPQAQAPQQRAPAVRPTQQSAMGDDSWPSPSQTSVGQAMQHKAEGGEVENNNKIRELNGKADQPVANDKIQEAAPLDIGRVKDIIPKQEPKPEVPKERVETQKLYNSMISGMTAPNIGSLLGTGAPTPMGPGFEDADDAPSFFQQRMFGHNGEPPQSFDAKVWQQAEQQQQKQAVDSSNASQQKAQQLQADNEVRSRAGLPPLPVPGLNEPTGVPADQQPQATEAQPASMAPKIDPAEAALQGTENMITSGYQQKATGINQAAQAAGALGEQQAQVQQQQIDAQQAAQTAYKQHYDMLEAERQNHIQDIQKGYIDPEQYWTGVKDPITGKMVGGHSKLLSAIGMIISGFGGGMSGHGGNAALDVMKYQMNQNLEAQKANLGSKQNLLSANMRQFGNLKDATDMTRIMQSDIVVAELAQAAAKAQNPMAKAAAMQAIGQLKMETAPIMQQFAMRRAMISMASNGSTDPNTIEHMLGYMRVVNPEMAKEMQTRYVPGMGLATTPVPQEVRSQLVGKQQFGAALEDLKKFAVQHSGSMSPSAILEGQTKAANVQNMYREAMNGGVFKKGEQEFIGSIIDSDPTKFFNKIRVLPKLVEAGRENQMSLNILKKGYGLPAAAPMQQEPQIKTVNGVKYMRGPNGEAIKVK